MRRSLPLLPFLALVPACVDGSELSHGDGAAEYTDPPAIPEPPDSRFPAASPIEEEDAATVFAESLCEQYQACACGLPTSYGSDCEEELNSRWSRYGEVSVEAGLSYDAQCVGDMALRWDAQACSPLGSEDALRCDEGCRPYHGDKGAWQPCTRSLVAVGPGFHLSADDCDAQHRCWDGFCVPRCTVVDGVPDGDVCRTPHLTLACAVGLQCGADGRCHSNVPGSSCEECRPGVGEPCDLAQGCQPSSWCSPASLECVLLLDNGETCSAQTQCASGYCPNGLCGRLPEEGEACPLGRCIDGDECIDGVCEHGVPAVCDW